MIVFSCLKIFSKIRKVLSITMFCVRRDDCICMYAYVYIYIYHLGNFCRNYISAQESPNSKKSAENKKKCRQSSILPKYGVHGLCIFVTKAESRQFRRNCGQFRRNCGQFRRNLGQFRRRFFWLYWSKVSIINSAEIGLQWWNSAESRFLERNLKIPPKS